MSSETTQTVELRIATSCSPLDLIGHATLVALVRIDQCGLYVEAA